MTTLRTLTPLRLFLVALALLSGGLWPRYAHGQGGWDFDYTMVNVYSANADQYVVSTTNAIKRLESGVGVSYWCPATPGTGKVKMRFDFPSPVTETHLFAMGVYAANFGSNSYGQTSLWVSRDDVNWEQISACQRFPVSIDCVQYYDAPLPSSMIGATSLWIESRMNAIGWNILSQFLRWEAGYGPYAFRLRAKYACGSSACNQALQLNGSSYIRVPDNASLDLTGPFTIECWVKSDNPTKPLVMKWGDDGINDRSYSVTFMPDQKFQFGVARSDNQLDQNFAPFLIAPFNTTQWRHVACVYDGIQRLTYVDGVLQATKLTSGQVHIGTTDLAIGAHLRNNGIPVTESLTGLIDEVRIWNVARSEGQIRSTINKRLTPGVVGGYSGLVSCWNFEGNANDAKGTNNGNPVGAPMYVLASDQPVLFDCNGNGVYDGEEVGSNPALDLNNNGILDACECTLSSVCQTSPNSAGTGALMSYAGNSSLSGSLTLLATGCPTNVSGFFFYGTQPALVPLGNGWRCIGGTIARLPVVNTGATGVGARTLNYAQLPPNGPITAGSTKYFQFYYRDVQGGGSGFNLSNSLKVLFCP